MVQQEQGLQSSTLLLSTEPVKSICLVRTEGRAAAGMSDFPNKYKVFRNSKERVLSSKRFFMTEVAIARKMVTLVGGGGEKRDRGVKAR